MSTYLTEARSLGDWQRIVARIQGECVELQDTIRQAAQPVVATVETAGSSVDHQHARNATLHSALTRLNGLRMLLMAMESQLDQRLQEVGVAELRTKEASLKAMGAVFGMLLGTSTDLGAGNRLQEAVALYNSYRSSGMNEQVQADRARLREQQFMLPTLDDNLRQIIRQEQKRLDLELDRLEGERLNQLVMQFYSLTIPDGIIDLLQEYGVQPLPVAPVLPPAEPVSADSVEG